MSKRAAIAAAASLWLAGAQAATGINADHVHAAFAFIRTGERTPILRNDTQKLTAVGANQMHTLGQNFRTRYIAGDKPNGLGTERIADLSTDIINNDQVWVQTLDTPYLISSAQAFMQGLYPPHNVSSGSGDATDVLADGTTIDYPLNGYQYASIQAASQDDPKSRLVSGTQNCPTAQVDGLTYLTTDRFKETYGATEDLYKSLTPDWFQGHLDEDNVNYKSAQEIYDYVNYQFTHDPSIHSTLANDTSYMGVYDQLRYLADEDAWYMYGNTSTSSTDVDLQAIGGKTLAAEILKSFRLSVADKNTTEDQKGTSHPLTFYFGEQDAMISLLSLMMLDSTNSNFKSIPPYASAMLFELFSAGSNTDDLWVRFSFHNGSSSLEQDKLVAYPMFGSARSQLETPWSMFQEEFGKIGIPSMGEWCNSCESASSFCSGTDGNGGPLVTPSSGDDEENKEVSPAVAGAIGAIITIVLAGLLFAAAMILGGLRLHRVERNDKSQLGGFKGSSKLASDPDVSLAGNGAGITGYRDHKRGHERVSSWELRQKEFGSERSSEESFGAIDAVTSRPAEAHQRV